MTLTLRTLLLIISVFCFVLAAIGLDLGPLSLLAVGVAFFAVAFIVPDTALGGGRR